jgi:hypothetical protein
VRNRSTNSVPPVDRRGLDAEQDAVADASSPPRMGRNRADGRDDPRVLDTDSAPQSSPAAPPTTRSVARRFRGEDLPWIWRRIGGAQGEKREVRSSFGARKKGSSRRVRASSSVIIWTLARRRANRLILIGR